MKLSKIEVVVYACVGFIAVTVSDRLNYNALSWQSFLIIVIPLLITCLLYTPDAADEKRGGFLGVPLTP
ncbi:hypothetical protein CG709_07045, partial [Lachnotalea glycerini]